MLDTYMMGHVGIHDNDKVASRMFDAVNVCGSWSSKAVNDLHNGE